MKKIILLSLMVIFLACEKDETDTTSELKSLANTEWTGVMSDYYDGTVIVKGLSNREAALTVGAVTITFNYTYNPSLKTGTLTSEGSTFIFEIEGNKLLLTDSYGDSYNFMRTK